MAIPVQENLRLLSRDNEQRPVAWRWRRAQEILRRIRANRPEEVIDEAVGRYSDPAVHEAIRYLDLRSTDAPPEQVYDRFPAVYEAAMIYVESGLQRWRIEGLVLADDAEHQIANRSGLSEDTVHIYEKLFFDVRSRLARDYYVLDTVIRGTGDIGYSDQVSADRLWKLLGYAGYRLGIGTSLLDSVSTGLSHMRSKDYARLKRLADEQTAYKLLLTVLNTPANLLALEPLARNRWERERLSFDRSKHREIMDARPGMSDADRDVVAALEDLSKGFDMTVATLDQAMPRRVEGRVHASLEARRAAAQKALESPPESTDA